MNRCAFLLFIFFHFGVAADEVEKWVLTDKSIGEMRIAPKAEISLNKIRSHFLYYKVTHEIGMGDSSDFHIFTVARQQGEDLISFISYIENDADYDKGIVKLDEVIIHSPKIKDEFGIAPGMEITVALEKRKDMEFGAGHMDNYLGGGKIWYLFSVKGEHGIQVTKKAAIASDSKIDVITWPYPRWR